MLCKQEHFCPIFSINNMCINCWFSCVNLYIFINVFIAAKSKKSTYKYLQICIHAYNLLIIIRAIPDYEGVNSYILQPTRCSNVYSDVWALTYKVQLCLYAVCCRYWPALRWCTRQSPARCTHCVWWPPTATWPTTTENTSTGWCKLGWGLMGKELHRSYYLLCVLEGWWGKSSLVLLIL